MTQPQTSAPSPLLALREIVCHKLRINCLIALTNRQASTKELAEQLGADKGTVAYHVRKLAEVGAIEIVETRETRGPAEAYYRAVQRPLIDDEESAALPKDQLQGWLERILALIIADTTASMQSGTFVARPDHNLVRFPTSVDAEGWEELGAVFADALEQAMDIEARSAGRMAESGEAPIAVRAVTMMFEMPQGG